MESLSESTWDVVICGTGLQQSLLALALSRSGKKILHLDPNEYYGGPDAALSLQEVDKWATSCGSTQSSPGQLFNNVQVANMDEENQLSFSRAYSLALAPQLIHTRSELLSQLVSSKAFKQVEFQAVGSFYIFKPSSSSGKAEDDEDGKPSLSRIPSTREEVFSTSAIPARSKRHLMKFLKFVMDYEDEEHVEVWKPHADSSLSDFLQTVFKLDEELIKYVLALTLKLDAAKTTSAREGLAVIHRHLSSMGMFGPGFAAVYPKWGGMGEIAQVACRAQAVGGGVYMLGTGIRDITKPAANGEEGETEVELSNQVVVKTRCLVQAGTDDVVDGKTMNRMIAVVSSPLSSLFEATVEGAPSPVVAVVAFPEGTLSGDDESSSFQRPVFATVHSSETGECPAGQSIVYLSTLSSPGAKEVLNRCLLLLLQATDKPGQQEKEEEKKEEGQGPAKCLYKVEFDQSVGRAGPPVVEANMFTFPLSSASLAFEDWVMDGVRQAWEKVMGPAVNDGGVEYMVFTDREPLGDDDDDTNV